MRGVRQWKFYTTTPGHNRYLINHWIVNADAPLPPDVSSDAVFRTNLASSVDDPNLFYTSKTSKYPAAAWRLVNRDPGTPMTLDGLPLAMQRSDYQRLPVTNSQIKLIDRFGRIGEVKRRIQVGSKMRTGIKGSNVDSAP
jgi:hypothetical protein